MILTGSVVGYLVGTGYASEEQVLEDDLVDYLITGVATERLLLGVDAAVDDTAEREAIGLLIR